MSGVITGIDGVEIDGMGTVTGRRVGRGDTPANSVGTLLAGRVASEANLRVCARFWLRADIGEFEYLPDGSGWYDRATGQAYEVLDSDPLFADRPDELATLFSVQGDRIVFLRRREGVTVQTVERDQAKRAREVEAEAERERKFRERQPKTPMLLHERYGERFEITVREAARQLLDAEGTIKRGTHGELDVRIPGRLTGDAVSEHGARQQLLNAAEVLIAGSKVVLAEIERAEGERAARKQRLDERLPDKPVTLGGGV